MTGDLFINNVDAYLVWGVNMNSGFISALLAPSANKELIENESRLEHGKRVIVEDEAIQESRTLTLTFHILGTNAQDYLSKHEDFVNTIRTGVIKLKVPALGDRIFKLIYKKSISFDINRRLNSAKISVSFEEINPTDRG